MSLFAWFSIYTVAIFCLGFMLGWTSCAGAKK